MVRGFAVVIDFVFGQCHNLVVVGPASKLVCYFGVGKFAIEDAGDMPFERDE